MKSLLLTCISLLAQHAWAFDCRNLQYGHNSDGEIVIHSVSLRRNFGSLPNLKSGFMSGDVEVIGVGEDGNTFGYTDGYSSLTCLIEKFQASPNIDFGVVLINKISEEEKRTLGEQSEQSDS
jgi:hypothetical protein